MTNNLVVRTENLPGKSRSGQAERELSLRCLERSNWTPADQVPANLTRDLLAVAVDQQAAIMAPAPMRSFAVVIEKLISFAATFGVQIANPKAAVEFYREALGDLPEDLLATAVRATMSSWVYQSLPKPAEIRRHVSEELSRRVVDRGRLQMALARVRSPSKIGDKRFDATGAVKRIDDATRADQTPCNSAGASE